jgi:hypothetical protein
MVKSYRARDVRDRNVAADVTLCRPARGRFRDNIILIERGRDREKETLMAMPAICSGESLTRLLQGAAVGVIGTLVVGFTWGGWTLGSTAEKMANERATAAVVKVLAPACVQRFQQQADMTAQWAAFKKVDSWQRDSFIEKSGFATPIGSKAASSETADQCASMLTEILDKKDNTQAAQATKS